MSNSDLGNEPAGHGPLDVKKLQNFFTASESIVLEGLGDIGRKGDGDRPKHVKSTQGGGRGAEAGEDPMRPFAGSKKRPAGDVFGPASPAEIQPRERPELKLANDEAKPSRPGKRPVTKAAEPVTATPTASGGEGVKAAIPPKRNPAAHPREFADDLDEVVGTPLLKAASKGAAPVVPQRVEGAAPRAATGRPVEAVSDVAHEAASTFGIPVETRERWGLGASAGRNRQHVSPAVLVGCAVLIQTGITLLAGTLFWKAFAAPWVERQVAARSAPAAGSVAADESSKSVAPAPLKVGTPSPAEGLVREEALLVLSTLADHALVTGERRFLDEFRNIYQAEDLDRLVHRFAVAREGAVLAAFRDRPARYALQVDAVLPESGKARESQLTAVELTTVLTDERRTRMERARAAYLLRSTRDYQVVDQIAGVLRDEQDLEVLVNALYAFLAITACDDVEGFDVAGMLEWWNRNRTDLLAGSAGRDG